MKLQQTLLIGLLMVISSNIYSQKSRTMNPAGMKVWSMEEVMKIPYEILIEADQTAKIKQDAYKKTSKDTACDYAISDDATVEGEIHAAINPTNSNCIVLSPIRTDFDVMTPALSCPVYYTTDGGANWNKSSFANTPHINGMITGGGGDPVLAYDADGKLYFSWIDFYASMASYMSGEATMGMFWAYSNDNGANWIQPTNDTLRYGKVSMNAGVPEDITIPVSDKQWMACDYSNSPYRNNLYVSYMTMGVINQKDQFYIGCSTKPAGEDKFTTEVQVSDPDEFSFVQYASIDVDNNGNVHVVFFGSKDNQLLTLWHSVSVDGGASFSVPSKITDIKYDLAVLEMGSKDVIEGIKEERNYPAIYVETDRNNGNLYLTWTAFGVDADAGNGADIYFSSSTDGGDTWSSPIIVNDDPKGVVTHNYFSSIYVAEDGDVCISWYDRRDATDSTSTHYYFAVSENQGLSFGENSQISSAATDFATVGSKNAGMGIGEYTQILVTSEYYIPIWSDGRNNDGDLNVYVAFISRGTSNIDEIRAVSDQFSMSNIYPNPVRNTAKADFFLKNKSNISLRLLSIDGKEVKTYTNKEFPAGSHSIDISTEGLESGKYFCLLETDFGYVAKSVIVQK